MNAIALAPLLGAPLLAAPWTRWRIAVIYRWRHGRWPTLESPKRFTEWIQWRKLNERSHALALLTDKAHSKDVAEQCIGEQHVIPTLWLSRDLPEVAPWPMPFIVKANHGCGQFVVVRTAADYRRARTIAPRWLEQAYGGLLDERQYRSARRLVLVEPFIGGAALPLDYKVYVFGGRAQLVQLHVGRGGRHRWTQYDRDWTPLSDEPIAASPPSQLSAMLAAAEAIAGDRDFLRVDFYCENDRLWFGECCLYPGSGLDPFRPDALDLKLGEYWAAARSGARRQHFAHQTVDQINGHEGPDHNLEVADVSSIRGQADYVDAIDRDALDLRHEFKNRAVLAAPFADVAKARAA